MAKYRVSVRDFVELEEHEGSWRSDDFRWLLDAADYGDATTIAEAELRDMCVMALQDREPAEAATLLLTRRLGSELTKGQIQNISHEMLDEKLWEEYADMPLHERLFHVGSLLYQAFPAIVPVPDAVEVRIEVAALDADARRVLAGVLGEPFLVRLLADGMPESNTLERMFREALGGGPFPEAESIAWVVEQAPAEAGASSVRVIGSGYWLDALRGTESYSSSAKADPRRAD